jgi:BirA family transcriptional regulator, biotin operon repressor / biotin---[acetyl-CoA-carboxylase] ligase
MFANQVIESCESTNDLARELGEAGFPHGTWVSARSQTRGRGRLGRQWQSMEGNLFLSIVVRPKHRENWTWVPMATAIAIAEAIRELYPELSVQVKWPNDLWIDRKKLGGILCEAVGPQKESFIIVGIGLNCAVAPEGLDQPTISLSARLERKVVADDVRLVVIRHVLKWTQLDPARIFASYEHLAALKPGTSIQWAEGQESGTVIGLGGAGELVVENAKGVVVPLFAEDVKVRLAWSFSFRRRLISALITRSATSGRIRWAIFSSVSCTWRRIISSIRASGVNADGSACARSRGRVNSGLVTSTSETCTSWSSSSEGALATGDCAA